MPQRPRAPQPASGLTATIAAMALMLAPAVATGQSLERPWEVEGAGGWIWSSASGDGPLAVPPAGPPLATTSPIFPTRQVPSWWFGDGALLLNGVNSEFGVPAGISPLEDGLRGLGLGRASSFTGGIRVRRALSAGYALEVGVDILGGGTALPDEVRAAVSETRDSFVPAFAGLLDAGLFSDVAVDTSVTEAAGTGREFVLTAAVVATGQPVGAFVPYVTLGGGLVAGLGDAPSVTLEGRYRFLVGGEVPIDETDRLTLRYEHRRAPVAVIGGGVRRDVSDRWGLRVDGRVLLGRQGTRLLLDAAPSSVVGTPADFVESFTNPAVQFSNNPSTGRTSTLSGPGLQGFDAFAGEAFRARVLVTAGLYVRF
jgi:hypothetical protein